MRKRIRCVDLVRLATPRLGIISVRDYQECGVLEGYVPEVTSGAVSWLVKAGFLERVGYGLYRRSR